MAKTTPHNPGTQAKALKVLTPKDPEGLAAPLAPSQGSVQPRMGQAPQMEAALISDSSNASAGAPGGGAGSSPGLFRPAAPPSYAAVASTPPSASAAAGSKFGTNFPARDPGSEAKAPVKVILLGNKPPVAKKTTLPRESTDGAEVTTVTITAVKSEPTQGHRDKEGAAPSNQAPGAVVIDQAPPTLSQDPGASKMDPEDLPQDFLRQLNEEPPLKVVIPERPKTLTLEEAMQTDDLSVSTHPPASPPLSTPPALEIAEQAPQLSLNETDHPLDEEEQFCLEVIENLNINLSEGNKDLGARVMGEEDQSVLREEQETREAAEAPRDQEPRTEQEAPVPWPMGQEPALGEDEMQAAMALVTMIKKKQEKSSEPPSGDEALASGNEEPVASTARPPLDPMLGPKKTWIGRSQSTPGKSSDGHLKSELSSVMKTPTTSTPPPPPLLPKKKKQKSIAQSAVTTTVPIGTTTDASTSRQKSFSGENSLTTASTNLWRRRTKGKDIPESQRPTLERPKTEETKVDPPDADEIVLSDWNDDDIEVEGEKYSEEEFAGNQKKGKKWKPQIKFKDTPVKAQKGAHARRKLDLTTTTKEKVEQVDAKIKEKGEEILRKEVHLVLKDQKKERKANRKSKGKSPVRTRVAVAYIPARREAAGEDDSLPPYDSTTVVGRRNSRLRHHWTNKHRPHPRHPLKAYKEFFSCVAGGLLADHLFSRKEEKLNRRVNEVLQKAYDSLMSKAQKDLDELVDHTGMTHGLVAEERNAIQQLMADAGLARRTLKELLGLGL